MLILHAYPTHEVTAEHRKGELRYSIYQTKDGKNLTEAFLSLESLDELPKYIGLLQYKGRANDSGDDGKVLVKTFDEKGLFIKEEEF